jgi:hypothetical protein
MKKFGPILGLIALMGIVLGFTFAPTSCSLTPDQQQRLQAIAVPATSIGLAYAQSRGLIEPGDKITLTQGVAIVVSDKTSEAKLFELTELGLQHAVKTGLLSNGDVVTVQTADQVTISSPPTGPLNPLLPALKQ